MDALQNLGKAMRLLRRHTGLTQRDAAARIADATGMGVTAATLSRWERGLAVPRLGPLAAFLSGLGFNFRDLCDLLEAVESPDRLDRLRMARILERDSPHRPTLDEAVSRAARVEELELRLGRLEARMRALLADESPAEE